MLYVLAADIGGTNCRLALFSYNANKITMLKSYSLPTIIVDNAAILADMYKNFILNDCNLDKKIPLILSIAFAGNVSGQIRAKLTNAELFIDIIELKYMLGACQSYLSNDFVAQAYSFCVCDIFDKLSLIWGQAVEKNISVDFLDNSPCDKNIGHELMAILGLGTGLGVATLCPLIGGSYMALPSEGGHSAFPFVGQVEYELSEFIKDKLNVPYVSCEHILSGGGMSLVYEFLTGQIFSAHEISANYLKGDILHYFSMFLGRTCRDLALSTLSTGGIYLTGGVLAKNPILVQHNSFSKEFYLSPKHVQWLSNVPIYLNTNENSGLCGAAYAGIKHYNEMEKTAL